MSRQERRPTAEAGFNLVELLVVIALVGLLAVIGYPSMLGTINRLKLTNAAREIGIFMQKARMEASKRSVDTRVIYQNNSAESIGVPAFLAFADLNEDGSYSLTDDDGDSLVEPADLILAGPYPLPSGIELHGPTESDPEGASSIVGWGACATPATSDCGPTFFSDGSANAVGAFRLRDRNNNFLETRIEFVGTGKVVVQKWFGGADVPANWWENGESGREWKWSG